MDEPVTAAEVIGDRRGEPLVEGFPGGPLLGERFGALGRGGVRDSRAVYDHPEPEKSPEGLGQDLEVAVLALAQPPVLVDRLGEAVERTRALLPRRRRRRYQVRTHLARSLPVPVNVRPRTASRRAMFGGSRVSGRSWRLP
jgi:hypothetical protein